ncbi:MAG TPA: hypothetical protein DHW82_06315 [Spirochaetia bacterium]|nr:hypothetical protein [Spirochaetia bacterium]
METEITSRFQSESRKKEFSLGRILLKKLIEQMTGSDYHSLSILKDSKGKPYLYPETLEKIHISLSHKSSFLWAGVSQKPFGIDIEKKDPRILNLKSKVFSFKKTLAQNEDELTFFSRLWTLQEAAVKCLETDFMDIASNLSLENFENGESLLIYYNKVKDIKIFLKGNSIESENYFFSIMRRE